MSARSDRGPAGLRWLDRAHDRHHHGRRLRVLGQHFIEIAPPESSLLDVGCGDGLLTRYLADHRPDLTVEGTDVLVRPEPHVPVTPFDGRTLPHGDRSFDVVLLVDVIHHSDDPAGLLAEAARVARRAVLIKDHLLQGPAAGATLGFMDRVSNLKHGVHVPQNYWTPERWQQAIASLGLREEVWRTDLGLYPWPARLVFERSLHFVARLGVSGGDASRAPAASPGA